MRNVLLRLLCLPLLAALARAQEFGAWHVVGRFEGDFAKNSTAQVLPPERALKQMKAGSQGPDLSTGYDGMDKQAATWRRLTGDVGRNVLDVGTLDFNALCPPPPSRKGDVGNAVAYLYRRIDAERDISLPVFVGSDDGVKLWLNGDVLLEKHVPRGLVAESDVLTLQLKTGANHLLVKVTNGGDAFAFQIKPRARISQDAINEAIDRGVQFLIREQLVDGSWGCWDHWGAGHPAYVAYTLMKCGVKKDHPAVRMALALLDHRAMDTTYARACAMLALEARGDAESRDRMQEYLAELIATQTTSGLWDYPVYPGGSQLPMDMSNTLYAASALRAASKSGLEVPAALWTKLASGVLRYQEKARPMPGQGKREMAGFGYRIAEGAFGSVTTGGVSCLAICEQEGGSQLQAAVKSKLASAKELGMNWLEHHLEWGANPGHGTSHHYFWVYGIERVGALMAVEKIGAVDWYWDGAAYLVRSQRDDGSWNPEGYVDHQYLDTCLALLFLKRATARGSGESSKVGVFETDDAKAAVQLRATGDTPLTVWVSGLSDEVHARFRPQEGSDLDVVKIEYFTRFEGYVDHQYLDTCLALLFLKRATARGSGESSKVGVFETDDAKAAVQLRATGDTPLTVWVSGLSDEVHARFRPQEGSDLDVVKIEYFTRFESDKDAVPALVGAVEGSPARRTELQRFALRHRFDRRGKWLVTAKVHLRAPGSSNVEVVDSPELAVAIDGVIDSARLEYAADRGRSLFYGAKYKAESSTVEGGDGGHLAFDGNHATRWRCAKDDTNPWLRVTLDRPARADGLLLSHGLARLSNGGAPRAQRVAVVVNKTQTFAVDMPDDVHAKARLSFGELLNVRELEVRIVTSQGRGGGEPVGFSELELVKGR